MNNEIKVNAESANDQLNVRVGKLSDEPDFKPVKVSGVITTPLDFLLNPAPSINNFEEPLPEFWECGVIRNSRLEVDETQGSLRLVVMENWSPTSEYVGKLSLTDEF